MKKFLLLVAVSASLIVVSARADTVIFDNLANNTNGFGQVTSTTWNAQEFNSDASHLVLTSATLILYSQNGGSGSFFLDLFSDSSGQPGTAVATLYTGGNPFSGPYPQFGNILFSGLSQTLTPNTNYWLVLGENAGTTFDLRWGATSTPTGSGSGFQPFSATTTSQGGTWSVGTDTPHQAQITANVPEPTARAFLIGAAGLLVLLHVRRRNSTSSHE